MIDVPAGSTVYLHQAMALADVVLVAVRADVSFSTLAQMDSVLAPLQQARKTATALLRDQPTRRRHRFSGHGRSVSDRSGDALLGTVTVTRCSSPGLRPRPPRPYRQRSQLPGHSCPVPRCSERIDSDLP